ncbi:MAG: tRNA (adenosine(37)-N6)-threonylcarbamoyltransferase complex ATPase subunit type 1 TsaE [Spirochaetaceae bacterium]|jgi:tRNA threonylcarbamoyladenosine biosynthesis protein TsaE|nr:tRNA (adenosine(37)-N6)-threonylcarbamoyltransferase complex ATPase subunit type 1 TsaE [Spirochaetaceae bacterium]
MADFDTFVTALFNHPQDCEGSAGAPETTPCEPCVVSSSAGETVRLGAKIGALLTNRTVIAVHGGLGAGKTCLAGGIARALGVCGPVTSPTYTIVNEYEGALCTFYHIDAYRLSGAEDFFCACGNDFFDREGVYLVEWPEHIAEALPPRTLQITMHILENGSRLLCPVRAH